MNPKKIQPYFNAISQKNDGENSMTEGNLVCCNDHAFQIFFVGEIRRTVFSNIYLFSENDVIMLKAHCKHCGKIVHVFDSRCDGYENCGEEPEVQVNLNPIKCRKCGENDFCVRVKYEYPDIKDLENLGIEDIDNAFTWIWISLTCNKCGAKYKNFVDYETS